MPANQKANHLKAKKEIEERLAKDPEALDAEILKLAEGYIPADKKKGYDMAKKFALMDNNTL